MNEVSESSFKFSIHIPRIFSYLDRSWEREIFYEWIWSHFSAVGLIGIHEGTVLCDEATGDLGVVDSAEVPRERDWVGGQEESQADLYFSGYGEALKAMSIFEKIEGIRTGSLQEQKSQDWDAEWKASFLNAGMGIQVAPFWHIVPFWVKEAERIKSGISSLVIPLKINPGAGFGTGTHETTQLCLEWIGKLSKLQLIQGTRVLDFGSGSGILSIALAKLGALVDAVEIDSLAMENALENATINGVQDQICFKSQLPREVESVSLIVANILRPVLLDYSVPLTQRLDPDGSLILSGLIESDILSVASHYSKILPNHRVEVSEKGEWRALIFSKNS